MYKYKLKDICHVGSSKRIFAREYSNQGIPFFRSQEVIECAIKGNTSPSIYISKEKYHQIISSGFQVPIVGDILMSAIGANRGYPWVVDFKPLYFKDGNVIWLNEFKSNICNSRYIAYYFSKKEIINDIQKQSEHSAQGAITIDLIKNLEIELPSITLQQHIVNTTSTLPLISL